MAYATGIANSFAELATALRAACTGAGWTLSGEVLHKGNCYVRVWPSTWTDAGAYMGISTPSAGTMEGLHIRGGTGVDGSNNLTGGALSLGRIGRVTVNNSAAGASSVPFTFPVSYFIHVHANPDEVYLVVQSDVDYFQHMAFGHSPLAEATGGTGCWYGACLSPVPNQNNAGAATLTGVYSYVEYCASGGSGSSFQRQAIAPPFFAASDGNNAGSINLVLNDGITENTDVKYRVHHGVDLPGGGWSGFPNSRVTTALASFPLFGRGPSAFNAGAPLLPLQGIVLRASTKVSPVLELEHCRLVKINHYAPGQQVDYGPDSWHVYPWYRKDSTASNGVTSVAQHSGCLGFAVRYDP